MFCSLEEIIVSQEIIVPGLDEVIQEIDRENPAECQHLRRGSQGSPEMGGQRHTHTHTCTHDPLAQDMTQHGH